ncbi:hypothetical protein EMCRGX_G014525 [Ephydatia muelleri]
MDKTARAQVKRAAETALRCLSRGLHVEALYELLQLTRDHPEHVRAIKQSFLSSLAAFLDSVNCGDSQADLERFSRVAQDVCEVYSHDEAALTMLGVKCLDEGLVKQAQFFLEAALRVDPDCLGAKENLRALYDRMVMRWHFLMLNDLSRNMAYANAVDRAVSRRPDCCVLDIGSGTGILSMMAARSGAKMVSACDFNETLFSLSRDIVAANGFEGRVNIIHALSTSLTVPRDILNRADLVVTEIVDAGLLGEYIVPTLRHAWKELLLPRIPRPAGVEASVCGRGGRVIPRGATVYAVAIECPEIRRQSRLLSSHISGLDLSSVEVEGSDKTSDANGTTAALPLDAQHRGVFPLVHEPYTCERLAQVRGGYLALTGVHKILEFDFSDPEIPLPESDVVLAVTSLGQLDAIATWFDLHLDEEISISTSPLWDISWEQALFPMQRGVAVDPGNHIHLHSSCSDILLDVRLWVLYVTRNPFAVSYIERHEVCRLNDVLYMECYLCSLREAILTARKEALSGSESEEDEMVCEDMQGLCIGGGGVGGGVKVIHGEGQVSGSDEGGVADCLVLDLTHGPSLFGIVAAKEGADFVQVGRSQPMYQSFQTCVAEANGVLEHIAISRLELSSLTPSHPVWDVVVSDVVGPQGTLRPGILDELAYLRSQFFHSGTEVLPSKVTLYAVCISSPALKAQSCVLGTIPTLGFDIASFINRYQVSHFVDVDLSTLPHEKLSNTFELLTINFGTLSIKPLQAEAEMCVTMETSGAITGVAYWFELALGDNQTISTGPSAYEGSHWHQAAFLLGEDLAVSRGHQLLVRGVVRDSCLDISLRAAI